MTTVFGRVKFESGCPTGDQPGYKLLKIRTPENATELSLSTLANPKEVKNGLRCSQPISHVLAFIDLQVP